MVIDRNEAKLTTLEQLRQFLAGMAAAVFKASAGRRTLCAHRRRATAFPVRGPQASGEGPRLALPGMDHWCYRSPKVVSPGIYTEADVALLAETDALHSTLSGPATGILMRRAVEGYGDTRYERWAGLSVGHLYNLRQRAGYLAHRQHWTKTKGTSVSIGERRAPSPDGRPGFIRIDRVHQGDLDGIKGVYPINAVDGETQWEQVATCEKISEAYRLPVIRQLLDGFPYSDPGLSCRQRLGVHQPPSGQDAGQTAGGVHPVTPPAFQRQRLGGDQERRGGPQAFRV